MRRTQSNIPALVGAIGAAMTTGGPTYAFGLYGGALKRNLGLSQSDLDTISTAFFVSGLMSWAPGLCADRFGARLSIMVGGCMGSLSLTLFWCLARQFIVIQSHFILVTLLSFLGVCIFASCAMVTGSVFKVLTVVSGPSKGSAVGVAKGLVGLGSGVYTVMFESIKGPSESALDFLPMAAIFFLCFATIPAFFLIPSHKDLQSSDNFKFHAEPRHFRLMFLGLGGLALVIVSDSLEELFQDGKAPQSENAKERKSPLLALLLMSLWWGPLLWVYRSGRQLNDALGGHGDSSESNAEYQLTDSQDEEDETEHFVDERQDLRQNSIEDDRQSSDTGPSINSSDRNLWQMLSTPESYLLLWSALIMTGSGTVETNNMAQMVEALGLSSAVTPASMALFSVAQASARVITGAASENTLHSRGWPRPIYLMFASCIGIGAHLLLSVATTEWTFVFGATLSGVNFGMIWPILVLCVGEIFGPSHVGANYMFYDGAASAAGTLLLSKFVAQRVYENHIDPATAPDPYTCIGVDCFRSTHILISIFCATALASSWGFVQLTKGTYAPMYRAIENPTFEDQEDSDSSEEDSAGEDEDNIEMEEEEHV